MTTLECTSCNKGPCHQTETPDMRDDWPIYCLQEVPVDFDVEWTRMVEKKDMLIIRQPTAMKIEIKEYLDDHSISPMLITGVLGIIDQYAAEVGE